MTSFSVDEDGDPPPPPRATRVSGTPQSASASRGGQEAPANSSVVFFGSNTPRSTAAAAATPSAATPSSGCFRSGQTFSPPLSQSGPGTRGPVFDATSSFRSMHNFSPSPSPRPSPMPASPQSSRLASPEAQLANLSLQDSPSANRRQIGASPSVPPAAPPHRRIAVPFSRRIAANTSRTVQPQPGTGPYNIRDEVPPEHAFFSRDFQTALRNGLGVARGIADMIRNMPPSIERGPEIQALLGKAENMGRFIGSDTRTVAVLGDSGEGSSRLWRAKLIGVGL